MSYDSLIRFLNLDTFTLSTWRFLFRVLVSLDSGVVGLSWVPSGCSGGSDCVDVEGDSRSSLNVEEDGLSVGGGRDEAFLGGGLGISNKVRTVSFVRSFLFLVILKQHFSKCTSHMELFLFSFSTGLFSKSSLLDAMTHLLDLKTQFTFYRQNVRQV